MVVGVGSGGPTTVTGPNDSNVFGNSDSHFEFESTGPPTRPNL